MLTALFSLLYVATFTAVLIQALSGHPLLGVV
jgi:hypothetical protein